MEKNEEEKQLPFQLGDTADHIKDKLRDFWYSKDFRFRALIILGIIGITLIFLSDLRNVPSPEIPESEINNQDGIEEYVLFTEKRLENIIQQIDNVGECHVMITVKQGRENIYASEEKSSEELKKDMLSGKNTNETKLVLLKNRDGNGVPLLEKTIEPQINGVIVVCKGAQSAKVRQQVTEAVTTVLGIRSTQVCVSPKSRFK